MEIKNWSLIQEQAPFKAPELRKTYIYGEIYGNPQHVDGKPIKTSSIQEMRYDPTNDGIMVRTRNSIYLIKEETIHPDYAAAIPNAYARMVLAHGGKK